jgi:hypothetical protein
MGYRSDVAYKIKFENEGQWNVFLIEAKSKPETRACFEDEALVAVPDKLELRFLAEGVKWYDDYEDVKCHMALLELCDEYNERIAERDKDPSPVVSYLFRRIGEDEDDCDNKHGGDPDWDWIELVRYLRIDWEA